jgi:4-hydroxyphenylacetate 3-monooxygenase
MGLQAEIYPRATLLLRELAGGGVIQLPSSYQDLLSEETRGDMERYLTSPKLTARERVKLFKLAWDALGTEFGGRHELYELNYAGGPDQVRLDTLAWSRAAGLLDDYGSMVERCMDDYDLDGWTRGRWSDKV